VVLTTRQGFAGREEVSMIFSLSSFRFQQAQIRRPAADWGNRRRAVSPRDYFTRAW
jgi:hypothetical protein